MSSILKALKKLEREKSLQRDDHIDLARDIFRGGERRSGPDWLTVIIAGTVVFTVIAVILFVLRQMEHGVIGREAVQQPPQSRVETAPLAPQVNASVVEELVDQRRPQVRTPVTVQRPSPPRKAPVEVASIPVKGPEAVVIDEVLPLPPTIPHSPTVAPTSKPKISPAPEGFVLSAIVFQPQREARIAVINELPVMEGSQVGEYQVEEIQVDRVILSHNGTLFEVLSP